MPIIKASLTCALLIVALWMVLFSVPVPMPQQVLDEQKECRVFAAQHFKVKSPMYWAAVDGCLHGMTVRKD